MYNDIEFKNDEHDPNISWDKYYLSIVSEIAKRSHCMSVKIGAILVKDHAVISTGYNGPPRKVPHCDIRYRWDKSLQIRFSPVGLMPENKTKKLQQCPRQALGYGSGEALELCPAAHAETNSIVQAARLGISTYASTMFVTCGIPCKNCLGLIINAGIDEVVCTNLKRYDALSSFIINTSGLKIRTYDLSD